MKMFKRGLRTVVILMVSTGIAYGKATTNIAVFNHSTGARQIGMADVAVGIADDSNAMFYNPAGIATVRKLELNAMYFDNIVDTTDESISLVYPLRKGLFGKKAGLGLSIKAYQGGSMDFITYDEATQTILSQKTIKAESDYMVGIGYSEKLLNLHGVLYGGLVLKGIHSTLVEDYTASAVAVDAGLLYKTSLVQGLSVGLSLLNNGTEMKFINEGDALPQRTIVGVGYSFKPVPSAQLTAGIDYIAEKNEDGVSNVGVELLLMDMISIRGGYLTDSDLGSVTAGMGVKIGMFQLDYGYAMMDELDSLQKVSLTVRWDVQEPQKEVKKKYKKRTVKKKSFKKKPSKKTSTRKKQYKKALAKHKTSKRYSLTK